MNIPQPVSYNSYPCAPEESKPLINDLLSSIQAQLGILTRLRLDFYSVADRIHNIPPSDGGKSACCDAPKIPSLTDSLRGIYDALYTETSKLDELSNHLNKVV